MAGDIGGTKTVLALYDDARLVREQTFASADYPALEEILFAFLREERLTGACFAVAGPVQRGRVQLTNLAWKPLDETELGRALGTRVVLLNDVQAGAFGMLFLPDDAFETLHAGQAADGNVAVIAPGTGLGEALLVRDGTRFLPVATEGGHASFAPCTDQQIAYRRVLGAQHGGHVSVERVLCGDGFGAAYRFLGGVPVSEGDPNRAVTSSDDPLCVRAVDLWCSLLGAEAGDMALRTFATGGVIIGGGIAPQIVTALKRGAFAQAYTSKGRFSEWVARVPVRVALDRRAPVIGAAHYLDG